jgi:NADH dehydrogenase [ubiquinone] 1 alpha subcomplex assembly factor 5
MHSLVVIKQRKLLIRMLNIYIQSSQGIMSQCRKALRPDGLFLATLFGGQTVQELRMACTIAQLEREGGVSPRTSPLVQVRDAGNLLTRAGFTLPTVDVDDIAVHYPDVLSLVQHLREMGETNALKQRREGLPRDTALAAAVAYHHLFSRSDSELSKIPESIQATFQIMYLTGWSPDPASQPKSAQRGSATLSLKDLKDLDGAS